MKFSIFFIFLALTTSLTPKFAFANEKVSACKESPEFLRLEKIASPLKSFESLPKLVFIGKSAEHYVESKSGKLILWSQHSFKSGKSSIRCASISPESKDFSSAIYAPTLIDQTFDRATGNSFWQFHLVNKDSQLGVWNQKSRIFSPGQSVEATFAKMGVQLQLFELTHDEYAAVLTRSTGDSLEVVIVRYDSVMDLK